MIAHTATVARSVGEKDLALENLARVAQMPGFVSYGQPKLMHSCDPLSGDPRFAKVVESLAPK